MPLPRWLAFPPLAALAAACGPSSDTGPDFAARDSAGVEIVESNVAAWGDVSPWTVDTVPMVVIGQEGGEDPYLLSSVRGAVRLEDGSIVVLDRSRELRQFDANGRFIRAAGRRGPGPGEFGFVTGLQRCGDDELWVDADSRLSVWGIDLVFRREFAPPKRAMWPVTCFEGAGLLVRTGSGGGMDEQKANEIYVDSLAMFLVDAHGSNERELMKVALWEYILTHDGKTGIGFPHPFGRQTVFANQGPWMAVGDGHHFAFRSFDVAGRLRRITRGPVTDLGITDAMLERYAAADIERSGIQQRERLARAGNPMPDGYPALTALLADTEGNMWARRFTGPHDSANRWGVFDPAGRFLGHVSLPSGLTVYEIGADYVLGMTVDYEIGIQQVRMYRLHRSTDA